MKTHINKLFLVPVLVAGIGLMLAGRVTAQTFKTLHSFNGGPLYAGLILSGNTLYGTSGDTVFAVNTDGTGFTNLHSFTSGEGSSTVDLILSGNTLYGTTEDGGSSGNGTVFAVNTDGTGFTNLYSFTATSGSSPFTNSDGANPYSSLILSGNTLYGTALVGGSSGKGTVFAVNTDGTGFTNLHSFTGSDGANPFNAGLILSGSTLYGTTSDGGSGAGHGTVFAVNTDGTGFTNLHSFTANPYATNNDGSSPNAGLILSGNMLYGTAFAGGSSGHGTVFAVNTDGTGFTNLHSFTGSDGFAPSAGLILSGNTLYGTANGGGGLGYGAVFAISTDGTGFTTLYNFTGGSDGASPIGGLILSCRDLYGTTPNGGSSGNGTVFSLSTITLSPATLTDGHLGINYYNQVTEMTTVQNRDDHTATLLPNGKVLVAGGHIFGLGSQSSAELYNPVTRTWSATGAMKTNRFGHTATLLPNGKVLVAGGSSVFGPAISSAELYDPAVGTWSATGVMTTNRSDHTATLLFNGKVLVAGGSGSSSAEMYDPASGTWTATGSLGAAPSNYSTATLLLNGQVLFAQGFGSSRTELYDPTNGTWTVTGAMTIDRTRHTATLLPNGKVLVAGGVANAGNAGAYTLASSECYDPATGVWTLTGPMSNVRYHHTSTLLANGIVLVAGGETGNGSGDPSSVEIYDSATGTWSVTSPLAFPRGGHEATLLTNGELLLSGGPFDSRGATADLYTRFAEADSLMASGGVVPYSYAVTSGSLPNGLSLESDGSWTGMPMAVGTNSFTITATDANGCTGSQNYTLAIPGSGPVETTRPTVTIKAPASNARTNLASITVSGTAKDNTGVALVLHRLNGGVWQLADTANGFANWTADIIQTPGMNSFAVKSVDYQGNTSLTNNRTFFYVVPSLFTLRTNGLGDVVSTVSAIGTPTNGASLEVGRSYTITAVPGINWLFTNWTASVNGGPTNVVSSAAKYTFVMQANLTNYANFVTNRFIAAAGSYSGLFFDEVTPLVSHERAGLFTLKTDSRQKFSGKLYLDGKAVGYSGLLDLAGQGVSKPVIRKGKSALQVTVQMTFDGSDGVSGSVVCFSNTPYVSYGAFTSALTGFKAGFNLTDHPATNLLGTYTLVVDVPTDPLSPKGNGYGTITMKPDGSVVLAGYLGDYARFKPVAVPISKDGDWPLYATTYKGDFNYIDPKSLLPKTVKEYKGFIIGWMKFTNNPPRELLDSSVHWIKTANTNNFYEAGFTNHDLVVFASAYTAPSNAKSVRVLSIANGSMVFVGGNLTTTMSNHFFMNTNSAITVHAPNVNAQTMAIAVKAGSLKGKFSHPNDPLDPARVPLGAVLQDENIARGVFKGTNSTGSFRLESD